MHFPSLLADEDCKKANPFIRWNQRRKRSGKKKDFLRQPTLVIDKITNFNKDAKFGKTQKDAMVQALRRVGVLYRDEIDALKSAAGILEYPPKPQILHVMGKYFGTED